MSTAHGLPVRRRLGPERCQHDEGLGHYTDLGCADFLADRRRDQALAALVPQCDDSAPGIQLFDYPNGHPAVHECKAMHAVPQRWHLLPIIFRPAQYFEAGVGMAVPARQRFSVDNDGPIPSTTSIPVASASKVIVSTLSHNRASARANAIATKAMGKYHKPPIRARHQTSDYTLGLLPPSNDGPEHVLRFEPQHRLGHDDRKRRFVARQPQRRERNGRSVGQICFLRDTSQCRCPGPDPVLPMPSRQPDDERDHEQARWKRTRRFHRGCVRSEAEVRCPAAQEFLPRPWRRHCARQKSSLRSSRTARISRGFEIRSAAAP